MESFTLLDPATKLIQPDKLNSETVTYWRYLVKFVHEQVQKGVSEAEPFLEQILPELSDYCDYVRAFFSEITAARETMTEEEKQENDEESEASFVGLSLIEMTSFFDLSEEVNLTFDNYWLFLVFKAILILTWYILFIFTLPINTEYFSVFLSSRIFF